MNALHTKRHLLIRIILMPVLSFALLIAQPRTYYQYTPNGVISLAPMAGKVALSFKTDALRADRTQVLAQARTLTEHTLLFGDNSPYAVATLDANSATQPEVALIALGQLPGIWTAQPVLLSPDGVEHIITERLMVKLNKGADLPVLQREASKIGCQVGAENPAMPLQYALTALNGDGLAAANALMETHLFAWAQADLLTSGKLFSATAPEYTQPNDPLFANQWAIHNTATANQFYGIPASCATAGADMNVENAWAAGITGSIINVAVVDQGVDLTHPDLVGNLLPGYSATTFGATVYGPMGGSATGTHGTWCAGLIGAEANNGIGIAGVAYDAKILPVRCFYYTYSYDSWGANAITWAWQHGADVISCSWGGGMPSFAINDAIHAAVTQGRNGLGCLVFFASGNSNDEVKYPASNPEVIAVGASTPTDERQRPAACTNMSYWGASYGAEIDVVAPGTETVTTNPGGGYYNEFVGTSAACPNAAGVGALLLSANPSLTGVQARHILESTCNRVRPDLYAYTDYLAEHPNGSWNPEVGYGRVDAFQAISKGIIPEYDLGLYVNHPHFAACGNDLHISLKITNYGSEDITSFELEYAYDGHEPQRMLQTVLLVSGGSVDILLPDLSATTGSHAFTISIVSSTLNENQTDSNPEDNTASNVIFEVLAAPVLPYLENFESNSFSAGFWEVENAFGDVAKWEVVPVKGKSGAYAARVACSVNDRNGAEEKLISRKFDLSTCTAATLGFTYAYKFANKGYSQAYNNYFDSLFVFISSDCGGSWQPIYSNGENGENTFSTSADGNSFFVPQSAADWCFSGVPGTPCVQIDLTPYIGDGADDVRFMFMVRSHFGNSFYLDDIEVRNAPAGFLSGGGFACGTSTNWPPVLVGLSGPGPWDITYSDGETHTVTGIATSPYLIHPDGPVTVTLLDVASQGVPGTVSAPMSVVVATAPEEVDPVVTLLPNIAVKCEAGREPYVNASFRISGNGVLLNGTTACIQAPAFDMTTNSFVIELWINPQSLSGRRSLFWELNATGDTLFHAFFRNNGATLAWRVFSGGVYREMSMAASSFIPITGWSHLAFHYTVAPQVFTTVWYELNMQIFVNGINRAAANFAGLTRLTGGTSLRFGQAGAGGASFWGKMDEIRIWDKTLPEFSELQLIYNKPLPHDAPLLARYYRCNEASGVILADAAQAKDATLAGDASHFSASGVPLVMSSEWLPASAVNLDYTRQYGQIVPGYTGTLGVRVTNPATGCVTYRSTTVVDMTAGVTLPSGPAQSRVANAECTINGETDSEWTHYYCFTPPNQKEILLSVRQNGNNIGGVDIQGFSLTAGTTPSLGTGAGTRVNAPYVSNPDQWFVMNRYWSFTPKYQPVFDVDVRFYYDATDIGDLSGSLGTPLPLTDLRMYTVKGEDPNPDPDNNPATTDGHGSLAVSEVYGEDGYWEYTHEAFDPVPVPQRTWTSGTAFGANYAQFTVASLTGGGGGAGINGSGASLAVDFIQLNAAPALLQAGWTTVLEWQVANEEHVEVYLVEMSQAPGTWQEVASVKANQSTTYTAIDNHVFAFNQVVMYRIRALDADGSMCVSPVKEVSSGVFDRICLNGANPIAPGGVLKLSDADLGQCEVTWLDADARIMDKPAKLVVPPTLPLDVKVPAFAPGLYFLRVEGENHYAAFRIVIL